VPWKELTAKRCFCHGIESFPKTRRPRLSPNVGKEAYLLVSRMKILISARDLGFFPRLLPILVLGFRMLLLRPAHIPFVAGISKLSWRAYWSFYSWFATTLLNDFVRYHLRLQQLAPRCTSQMGRAVLKVMSSSLFSTLHIPVQFFLSFSCCLTR